MITEERYEFTGKAKKNLAITAVIGVVLVILGILMVGSGGEPNEEHGLLKLNENALASTELSVANISSEEEGEHISPAWLNRLYTNIWINNVYFVGLSIIGVFFVALYYASQAGWSAGVKRIPEAFGYWLPIGGILMLVMFFVSGHHIFHWTHTNLYVEGGENYDAIISGKQIFFFWPFTGEEGFPFFFLLRMVFFFVVWYWFFMMLRKHSLREDIEGGSKHWYKMRSLSAIFLVIFAVTTSIAAWDWVMSIDIHWFSTMFGWYTFASWWVSGLALITLIVISLKDKGYLSIVNDNHLHDLGKFIWAFTIFWTYIWFSQYLLIYYANIAEETIYFVERLSTGQYATVFYLNLILNFFLPFFLLMTRDAKRHSRILKIVCSIILIGHWFDFYLMITPGTMKYEGGFGFMEIGVTMIFAAAFLFVVFSRLAKAPLIAVNDPMLDESVHHHI